MTPHRRNHKIFFRQGFFQLGDQWSLRRQVAETLETWGADEGGAATTVAAVATLVAAVSALWALRRGKEPEKMAEPLLPQLGGTVLVLGSGNGGLRPPPNDDMDRIGPIAMAFFV